MSIDAEYDYDLNNIYRLILCLPSLKYNKVSVVSCSEDEHTNIFVPVAFNERFSTIEYLIINHPCTLNEILSILHHTPGLCHLTCRNIVESRKKIQNVKAIMLYKLPHIHFDMYEVWFDDFEIFIRQSRAKLKVLMFTTSLEDLAYMDAYRWERIILQDLPQLEKFSLEYRERNDDKDESNIHFGESNPFFSSFWLERQWIFETEINAEYYIYSVRPYK